MLLRLDNQDYEMQNGPRKILLEIRAMIKRRYNSEFDIEEDIWNWNEILLTIRNIVWNGKGAQKKAEGR